MDGLWFVPRVLLHFVMIMRVDIVIINIFKIENILNIRNGVIFGWGNKITHIILIFLLLVLYIFVNNLYLKRRGLPPGPVPIPLLGNVVTLASEGAPHRTVQRWAKVNIFIHCIVFVEIWRHIY